MILTDSIARYCVLAVVSCVGQSVAAQTADELMVMCEKVGDLAEATVAARDSGVPLEKAKTAARDMSGGGFNIALIEPLITLTYVMDGVEGPVMKQVAIQMCHKNVGLK